MRLATSLLPPRCASSQQTADGEPGPGTFYMLRAATRIDRQGLGAGPLFWGLPPPQWPVPTHTRREGHVKPNNRSSLYPLRFKEVLRNYTFGGAGSLTFSKRLACPRSPCCRDCGSEDRPTSPARSSNVPLAGRPYTRHRGLRRRPAGPRFGGAPGHPLPQLIKF
jgi:hypothetical protein